MDKIFDLDYICTAVLTENDLINLIDNGSFTKSYIVWQFRKSGDNRESSEILEECRNKDDWYSKRKLSKSDYNKLFTYLKKGYKNVWRYSDSICEQYAYIWMLNFSFMKK